MIRIPGSYRPSSYFPSFSSKLVKYRAALFLGGTALLLLLLVPGSLSVFAQPGTAVAPVLLSITVTPADAEILPDGTRHFTATGTFSDRHIHELSTTVTWSSSAPDVATISSGGLARAVGLGQTTIKAAVGAIKGSTTLNVKSFVFTGSMNAPRFYHTATILNNGMVLIVGGFSTRNTAELYNPATGIFTPTGSLNNPRFDHTATLLNNGMVLIAGGSSNPNADAPVASAELYNPATGTFTLTGSLNTARYLDTATLLNNGMVLFAGGVNDQSQVLASAELYNPATGTFTPTGSLNSPRYGQTATLLSNGIVLIAGGNFQTSAELYNPATGKFSYTNGSMGNERLWGTATLLNNGMVLMVGSGFTAGTTAELYNPATGTFAPTGSLNTATANQTATLLNNSMVLMAGNWTGIISLATAELYDPATETFTDISSLNTARSQQTATLLNNGIVLIAGGWSDGVTASAELYEPATLTPPGLASIPVTPKISTLSPGETQRFIATGVFRDGSTQQLASVTWSSSDPTVAQITNDASNHGVALAIAPGTSIIEARAGRVKCSATLTVR